MARHPFGRVPVLEHDGFRLYETQAILRYLDRVLPGPKLTPAEPKRAARMDQAMNIGDWYLFQGVANVIGFQRIVGPRVFGLTPDEATIASVMPKAYTVCDELARLLADGPYLAGPAMSLADLHVMPQVALLAETPEWEALGGPRADLAGWLARIAARPSMVSTTWERVTALAEAATA